LHFLNNLNKKKNQYLELLIIELAERYCIPYKEAKVAVNSSTFRDQISNLSEDGLLNLWKCDVSNILNGIWSEYSYLICCA
jgi:hypothetical protein